MIHIFTGNRCPIADEECAAIIKNGTNITYARNISWEKITKMSAGNKRKGLQGITIYFNPHLL